MKKRDNAKIDHIRKRKLRKRLKRKRKTIHLKPHRPRINPATFVNVAPRNFSFIENTDEMLEFFDLAPKKIRLKKQVTFHLSEIESLTSDAIAIYASLFTDKGYAHGLRFTGDAPKDPRLKEMFLGSGFYDHVISKKKLKNGENNFLLHKVSNKKTDTTIAKTATDFAAKFTFKDNRKFRPVYEILIELMANTNNHASPFHDGIYDWWLYVFYDKESNITSYTFLDLGVGIFKSKPFMKYYDLILITLNKQKSTEEMASDLLEGRITSRTGLGERGRGFTCITQNAMHPAFKKFVIITNKVYIDVKSKASKELYKEFKGTFVYWEIGDEY